MADHAAAAAPAGGDRAFDDLRAPSLYRRMACWLYEGMLLFGVYFAATAVFSLFAPVRRNDELHGLLQAFLFIVCGLYFAWCWSRGQTLAMKTWRIAMVDAQGRRVSQPRALWRYVLGVLLLGWVWIWALLARFHRQRQFWHDQWAGTRLVDVAPRATKGVPA
jgi:uncharacterized RDD family membrane protein YckC